MIISAEEFVALRVSQQPDAYLRAANDASNVEVWLDIIERFPEMRIWVAHNKTIPIEVLALLARDHDPEVRASVAMKNKLSYELFALLATDSDQTVRERIAYNKKTPLEILERLAQDPCQVVSMASRGRIRSSEQTS